MKKIFVVIVAILLLVSKVNAACVQSLNVNNITYRTNGHQHQCLTGYIGGYTTSGEGSVPSSCFSIGTSSIVDVRLSGTQFCFSPQAHGNTSITISVSGECTCSNQPISKTISFKLSEWGLKSLSITGYDISPEFYNSTMEYTATVPNHVTSIEINTTPLDRNSEIKITGNDNLQVGENKVTINVVTPQNDSRNYYITVTRSPSDSNDSSGSTSNPSGSTSNSSGSTSNPSGSTSNPSVDVPESPVQPSTPSNNDNPETGLNYMYFVFGLGIASIAYVVWYTKSMKINE